METQLRTRQMLFTCINSLLPYCLIKYQWKMTWVREVKREFKNGLFQIASIIIFRSDNLFFVKQGSSLAATYENSSSELPAQVKQMVRAKDLTWGVLCSVLSSATRRAWQGVEHPHVCQSSLDFISWWKVCWWHRAGLYNYTEGW